MVDHYAGGVCYSTEQLMEKNKAGLIHFGDVFADSLVAFICGWAVSYSTEQLMEKNTLG